jgi:RNA-dependent RNA polymerase
VVGPIATRHLRIADLKGYDHPECLLLAEKASHAVDFSKVGVPVVFRDLPVPPTHLKPDFLSGEGADSGANFYPSQKALGKLYRNVRYRNLHRRDKRSSSRTDCRLIHEALSSIKIEGVSTASLLTAPAAELMEQMEAMLDEYCRKLIHIAQSHSISTYPGIFLSEAEIVTGTSLELFCSHKKRKEYVASMNLQVRIPCSKHKRGINTEIQTQDLCNMVRQCFDDDANAAVVSNEPAQDGKPKCRDTLICRFGRAWAAWLIANENVRASDGQKLNTFGIHSFGLLALSTMLDTLQLLKNPQYIVEYDTSPLLPES